MKREAKLLVNRSMDSLLIAIDHFNCPWEPGRKEAVLILMDRAFELLLKAAILHKGGKIRQPGADQTIGFEKCVSKCLSEEPLKCLSDDWALTLRIVNGLRDAAQHHILDVSEQQLYTYTQAGVTLYSSLIKAVFNLSLMKEFPERILPVSTSPPKDLEALMHSEFTEIVELLGPGRRRQAEARAKLRPFAIIENSLQGQPIQPSAAALTSMIKKTTSGKGWKDVFPGIATLELSTEGSGLSVSIRISRSEGDPVKLVKEGSEEAVVVAVHKVRELDFYTLGLHDLADKVGIGRNKTLALVRYLKLQDSEEYYKEFVIGSVHHKRYSEKALAALKLAAQDADVEKVWREYGAYRKKSN